MPSNCACAKTRTPVMSAMFRQHGNLHLACEKHLTSSLSSTFREVLSRLVEHRGCTASLMPVGGFHPIPNNTDQRHVSPTWKPAFSRLKATENPKDRRLANKNTASRTSHAATAQAGDNTAGDKRSTKPQTGSLPMSSRFSLPSFHHSYHLRIPM